MQPLMHNILKSYLAIYNVVELMQRTTKKVMLQTTTHLESLGHVCRADLVILICHVTAFQLTRFVELKNAFPPQPPLDLLFGTVPTFFILVLLLLLTLFIHVCFKVGKVKVATKDFLGLLEGSVREGKEGKEEVAGNCFPQTYKIYKVWMTICVVNIASI